MAKTNEQVGVSGLFLLFLVFITLKLCRVIDWSWWWITAPLWGPLAILLAILVILGIILLIGAFWKGRVNS